MSEENKKERKHQEMTPSADEVQKELAKAKSIDDFFGKEGIFARLFANTIETMLDAELSEELGYEPYEAKGKNSGNSRNGHYPKKVRTSAGETTIQVPRNRNGDYEPQVVKKRVANTNELEDKIIGMYAKGMLVRDIQETLKELYGVDVSPATLSDITDKVWELVEALQNHPLASIYPIIYLDAIHLKLRREGKVETTAVYTVYRPGRGSGRSSRRAGTLGRGRQRNIQFLAQRRHRPARARRAGYLHRLHGWVEWFSRSIVSCLSPHPNPTLHHSPDSEQPEICNLDGLQAVHSRFTPGLPGSHPGSSRSPITPTQRKMGRQICHRYSLLAK